MVFTIQFVREFAKLGLTRAVGGVLALALARELTPVVLAVVTAGRVGSSFAAELGTMQVSEQMDSLRVLRSDPVDYLVTPRALACALAGPALNVMCFTAGIGASVVMAKWVYGIPPMVILDSVRKALTPYDVIVSMTKSLVFGIIIAMISCSWGFTTSGGARGVGAATTSAVVCSLVVVFAADLVLSFVFFQGRGDALRQLK
nr:lipid transfer machine permease (TGD1) [Polytomella parva]|eukprot:CAMPEP_0175047664 /NCGR_PEP_ID=MMETSP0052_2-20121109/5732_1 /TAXON_ID=51329 ORGANISM="Polytomella parva, Strain SAG 63-3" /NCGR_SAMPLE_ID=MMETSP0052_2 /ASSEMBLY_ACC=CAM_ASM_000194 /LENGTH=201 /DNA_ID=CAMNT_0016311587 /DNA_START=546 /DNA_END=1151 /DNA_ORIENTATION=+